MTQPTTLLRNGKANPTPELQTHFPLPHSPSGGSIPQHQGRVGRVDTARRH